MDFLKRLLTEKVVIRKAGQYRMPEGIPESSNSIPDTTEEICGVAARKLEQKCGAENVFAGKAAFRTTAVGGI